MQKLSMEALGRKTVIEYKKADKLPIIVVLDNVRSMHNVGSIFRTADAFLIQSIYLCGCTPQPPHRDIHKTALGATETVDWKYYATTLEAVNHLKQQSYTVCAVEQTTDSIALQNIELSKHPIAIILGNEVDGVGDEVLALCDKCIEIPQFGTKHSLNVSVAAGVVLWKLVHG
ncbi:MAG TPA: RNA methyltransferase [Chitinophagaceae bacterium]|nr:RNA methyltransferase [Chitinophagaceae bacterium]